MYPGSSDNSASTDNPRAAGKSTVKTFGLSHRDRAPLVFVETSRGSRADETFFLIVGPSARAQELFQAAIAEFRRGTDIRPPEEFLNLLKDTALRMEGGQLEQRLSFAAAWVRAGVCQWLTGGNYLMAQVSKEGRVLRLPGSSGKVALGHLDRLVASERAHFDDVEEAMRQGREHGDLAAILHGLSQERKLGGALVLEHTMPRGGLTVVGGSRELSGGIDSPLSRRGVRLPRLRLNAAWVFGFASIALALFLILRWPLAGHSRTGTVEEVSEPREVSAVSPDPSAASGAPPPMALDVTLSPAWTKKFTGAVTSSPRVVNGRVYFGCRDSRVYCLDAQTGREMWRSNAGSGVGASPAVNEGRLYVGSYDGTFWCLDASSGKALWRFRTGGKIVSSASVVSGNVVFGSYDRNVYCLSAEDGTLKWKRETGGLVWSSPYVDRGRCYVGSADGAFYCLLLGSGEVKWKYPAGGPVYSSPAGGESVVCAGSNSGAVFVLDARTGKEISRLDAGREVRSSVLLEDGNAYVGADDGTVRCMRVSDGVEVWRLKTGGATRSGPALQSGLLFVTSYDGKLHVIDAASGLEAASFDSRSQIYSSPAVSGDRVYFGTNDGNLVCLEVTRERKRE